MGLRGPQPATEAELKLRGTYRKDRHGKRAQIEAAVSGSPVKPKLLKGEASKWWDRNLPMLLKMGRVSELDSDFIASVAKAYALLVKSEAQLDKDPCDPIVSAVYARYSRIFYEGAKRLGLSPTDRLRLAPSTSERSVEEKPTIALFARKRERGTG